MSGRQEVLRARSIGGTEHEIGSIPFFAYGVARFDIVSAIAAGDRLELDQVLRRSGHRTLRIAVKDESRLEHIHEALHALLSTSDLATEWHSAGYAAVDLPGPLREVGLLPRLERLAGDGAIEFEIVEAV